MLNNFSVCKDMVFKYLNDKKAEFWQNMFCLWESDADISKKPIPNE